MPPAPGGGGGGQQPCTDNHMAPMWILLGVFVVVFLIWYLFKAQIISGFFFVKLQELRLIGLFTHRVDFSEVWIQKVNPADVTFEQMSYIATLVGDYIRIPIAVILVIFAVILYRKSIGHRFNKTYSMKSLLESGNKNWPQTTPVLGLELIKEDIDQGPWAMAKTPMQFAKSHNLLKIEKAEVAEGMLSHEAKLEASVIKSRAAQLFAGQVGAPWQGIERLNIHTKALFAVFVARIDNDPKGAADLLNHISTSARAKNIDFSGVDALLNKHKDHKIVAEVIKHHEYVLTVMPSLLQLARSTGVLATADFLWLKLIDRRLWYVLSSVGRQTPYVEVSGVFAHWLVEKALHRKVITPMIDEAVNALDEAIKMVIYKPDEDEVNEDSE